MKTCKIYLDSCCVSRPYDDQTQNRINSETAAIMQIISRFWNGEWQSISSTVLQFEINRISDLTKHSFVKALFTSIPQTIFVSVGVSETFRGKQLEADLKSTMLCISLVLKPVKQMFFSLQMMHWDLKSTMLCISLVLKPVKQMFFSLQMMP